MTDILLKVVLNSKKTDHNVILFLKMALNTTKTDRNKLYHFGRFFFYHNSKIKQSWPLNSQNSEQTFLKYCFSVKT
jgi:hypothetical protein